MADLLAVQQPLTSMPSRKPPATSSAPGATSRRIKGQMKRPIMKPTKIHARPIRPTVFGRKARASSAATVDYRATLMMLTESSSPKDSARNAVAKTKLHPRCFNSSAHKPRTVNLQPAMRPSQHQARLSASPHRLTASRHQHQRSSNSQPSPCLLLQRRLQQGHTLNRP